MAQSEVSMEWALIKQLTGDVSQWTYRKDIVDEESLWANFRAKLNQNNLAVLDGEPVTDAEFHQIREYMLDVAKTPYKAALWLAGENGEAVIPLTREDAAKGTIHLMAVSNREIAGGRSSYEVINQFVSDKQDEDDRERRFDVTLLINGLPMIHIELKNQDHPYMDAFRQIKKYSLEGKFRGLFGMVQMFVISNGSNTRYIAADTGSNLNERFLTSWVNKNNEPVENYLEFAKEVLRIPEAHEMVGHYSVVDAERHKLILLRPYQVHAIEAVKQSSQRQESGFVWHTTGSGKTLTSYTVAKNLILIPGIDKTIFLIDRKDLDQQTSISFKAYAENDIIDVDETDNVHDLLQKLKNKDRVVIVTTIQKMQIIMKRYNSEAKKDSATAKRLHGMCIAFVVDECHRTVTPETQRELQKFFSNSLWYGFTGTPIFDENKRQRKGDLARTTEALYGPCLHNYTIKEALHNNAVLGFQIDYKDSVSHDQLLELGEKLQVASADELANMEPDKLEDGLVSGTYQLIVTDAPLEKPGILCQEYVTEQLYVSLPPAHPLAKREAVHLSDLAGQTMLLFSELGVWQRLHDEKMQDIRFIVQTERKAFSDLISASVLPSFTTNLTQRYGAPMNRVNVPILDQEATIRFYLCVSEKHRPLLDAVYTDNTHH